MSSKKPNQIHSIGYLFIFILIHIQLYIYIYIYIHTTSQNYLATLKNFIPYPKSVIFNETS